MCNLNIVFKLKEKSITPFLMAVTSNSFASNDDGDGIYTDFDDRVIKSLSKINLFDYKDKIDNSKVIITHQRLSTSGHELEYCHPFESREFILVHNGIINQFLGTEGSDTSGFFTRFLQEFANIQLHISREEKIVKVLKKLFSSDEGTYSILIYDKKTNRSYYFKNSPSIHFYKFKDLLYITTNYENNKFLSLLNNETDLIDYKIPKELDIKSNTIYRIDDKIQVFNIGKLNTEKKEQTHFKSYNSNLYNYTSHSELCSTCGYPVKGSSYYFGDKVYCESCIEFINNYGGKK